MTDSVSYTIDGVSVFIHLNNKQTQSMAHVYDLFFYLNGFELSYETYILFYLNGFELRYETSKIYAFNNNNYSRVDTIVI